MIQFKPTRNIDLIEAVGNHPDIIAGSNNGDGYDYKPDCRYFEVNTTVQCVTSFAARKFRHGQMYCAMIGLKRVGTIKKYFKGVDDVTFYSATREELIDFLNHGR